MAADDIYRIYFHGPAYQVLAEGWSDGAEHVFGRYADLLPAATEPPDASLRTAPRSLELCFQTAGVWEIGTSGNDGAADAHRPGRRVGEHDSRSSTASLPIVTPQTTEASTPSWSTATAASRLDALGLSHSAAARRHRR